MSFASALNKPEDIAVGLARLDRSAAAQKTLAEKGFVTNSKPTEAGLRAIKNLTSLSQDQLAGLLQQISDWQGYVEEQLAVAKSELNIAQSKLDFALSRTRLEIKQITTSKMTVSDLNDAVNCNPTVVQLTSDRDYAQYLRDVMQGAAKSSATQWDTVSRRISQLMAESERGGRMNVVQRTPVPASPFGSPRR